MFYRLYSCIYNSTGICNKEPDKIIINRTGELRGLTAALYVAGEGEKDDIRETFILEEGGIY